MCTQKKQAAKGNKIPFSRFIPSCFLLSYHSTLIQCNNLHFIIILLICSSTKFITPFFRRQRVMKIKNDSSHTQTPTARLEQVQRYHYNHNTLCNFFLSQILSLLHKFSLHKVPLSPTWLIFRNTIKSQQIKKKENEVKMENTLLYNIMYFLNFHLYFSVCKTTITTEHAFHSWEFHRPLQNRSYDATTQQDYSSFLSGWKYHVNFSLFYKSSTKLHKY